MDNRAREVAAVEAVAKPVLNRVQLEAVSDFTAMLSEHQQSLGGLLAVLQGIPGMPESWQDMIGDQWQRIEGALNEVRLQGFLLSENTRKAQAAVVKVRA